MIQLLMVLLVGRVGRPAPKQWVSGAGLTDQAALLKPLPLVAALG